MTIDKIKPVMIDQDGANDGDALVWNSSNGQYEPTPGGAGSGDVVGPASSTDNAIARFDGTTGKTIQNSSVTIDDGGNVAGATIPADDVSIDNAGFDVLTSTDVQAAFDETDAALLKARGTEVIGGTGAVTFTAGATTFDVAATQGQIKDSTGYYPIDFAGQTGVAIDGAATSSIYVYIDKAGNLQQQLTAPTCEEYREKLFLTRLVLLEGAGTLAAQEEIANPSGQYVNQLRDFVSYFPSQKKGLNLSGNANLTFQVSAGSVFELGINNSSNEDCPNQLSFTTQNQTTFFYFKQDALISSGQTSINVTQYDNGGTLTTMTNNRFKIMTVYKFGSGNHVVQEGQAQYTSLDEAQTALSTRTFVENPVVANGTRLGWIIVQKNATDLTDTATARIIDDIGAFGTATTTVGALLASNNLSDVADVSTSRTNLGLGTGDDVTFSTVNTGQGANELYAMNQAVQTTDNVTFNNITVTGTVDGRDVAADGTKLDGIESGADVTDEANVTDALDGATLTAATVATDDKVLIQDTNDSNILKTVTAQSIADLNTTTFAEQSFTATASQTNFTLSNTPTAAWVWLNGVAQDASTWSISGSDIVLSTAATLNDTVEVYYSTGTADIVANANTVVQVNNQTGTAYTLALADASKKVRMNNASANTVTVPPNGTVAFPIGSVVYIYQLGAGQTTIVQGSGVTINYTQDAAVDQDKIEVQYGTAALHKVGTNEWDISGALST